ncbi:hypothetical protein [[Eubacterium] cellulosolvens]
MRHTRMVSCPSAIQVGHSVIFCQSTLTDIYPEWLRQHVAAYNAWARTKGRARLALAE